MWPWPSSAGVKDELVQQASGNATQKRSRPVHLKQPTPQPSEHTSDGHSNAFWSDKSQCIFVFATVIIIIINIIIM